MKSMSARLALLVLAGTSFGSAQAQIAKSAYSVKLQTVASGLAAPVQAKSPSDGSGRLFIVDQAGTIRILTNGTLLATPFLNVTSLLAPLNAGYDERGLLGMAFHPQFATNGRFFIHYTAPRTGTSADPCFGTARGCSSEVIAEYRVSAGNPNVADPASRVELLRVPKPQFNHAGGGIEFGPDGDLYISFGDGGGANDGLADVPPSHGPTGNAQNLAVPLGKVLRYDVSTPGQLVAPASNPFVNTPGALAGVYAYGLRNPYSFSFDDAPGGTGQLYLADVGQNLFEELDIIQPGGNYGWPIKEGTHCFDPFNPNTPPAQCPQGNSTAVPIADYAHTAPDNSAQGIAIIGGYVYRGSAMPALQGKYIFGDLSTSFGAADGHLFVLDPQNPAVTRLQIAPGNNALGLYLKGFGRDATGELYVLASSILGPTGTKGVVMKVSLCSADFNGDGFVDIFDFQDFVGCFDGSSCPPGKSADIDGDGFADVFDFTAFVYDFEAGC